MLNSRWFAGFELLFLVIGGRLSYKILQFHMYIIVGIVSTYLT